MRALAILGLAAFVAGCNAPQPANETTAAANPRESGYVKRVLALPLGQQRGVVVRAIQDGGGDCQTIAEFLPQPQENGRAIWAVRCDQGERWIVSIGDDGIATTSGLPAGG